ncbi:MAG: 50S ribosomal protein L29 [Candidatus Liptonbacteria bacterium]|nr:50S ribosomal protein L29 [Candidatus Liptonbacteria bacterium]
MKRKEIQELKGKSREELLKLLALSREQLQKLQFDVVAGKVKNISTRRILRKDVARILTFLRTLDHEQKG